MTLNNRGLKITLLIFSGCVIAAAAVPRLSDPVRDQCDVIWLQHFHGDDGRLVFDQMIFLKWNDDAATYDVIAWRLVKAPQQLPQRDWRTGGYIAQWYDGEVLRTVRAPSVRESHDQYDPELAAREQLPREMRRELTALPVRRVR